MFHDVFAMGMRFLSHLNIQDFRGVFIYRILDRALRKCGSKRDDMTQEWRRLHNEEISDLYSLPNIVRVIKWRRMSWAGHLERMEGEERRVQGFGGKT